MNDDVERSFERRLAALESRIDSLETAIRRLDQTAEGVSADAPERQFSTGTPASAALTSSSAPTGPATPVTGPVSRTPAQRRSVSPAVDRLAPVRAALRSEKLVSRIGIGLLLIGLAFLFKWGIDRGWITPTVRVGFGFAMGAFLLAVGLRIRENRLRFAQVLIGGGLATFYITIFSAFQLYELFPYGLAFSLMVIVTTLSFLIAVRHDDVVLAVIATAGGLGTPFLLFVESGSLLWLIVYTCIVCGSAMAIFFDRGWRWLLAVTVAGGWAVLAYAWSEINEIGYVALADRTVYQIGVMFCLGAFGVVPAVRDVFQRRAPDRWPLATAPRGFGTLVDRPALWLATLSPLLALALSRGVWDIPEAGWGAIEVVAATIYWGAYLFVRSADENAIASGFGVAGAVLLAVSWFDLFENESLQLVALAAEAAALHVATNVSPDRPLKTAAHVLFGIVATWMSFRLVDVPREPSLFSPESLSHVGVFAVAAGTTFTLRSTTSMGVYRVVIALLLGLSWFSFFAGGTERMLALAVEASAIIVWTQWIPDLWLRNVGNLLFGVVALAIFQRLSALPSGSPPLLNGASLADLAVIVLAAGASLMFTGRTVRLLYRFGAYLALLGWFWRDLVPLDDGHAFVSIAWGLVAIGLIATGWRLGRDLVRQTGLATLGIVVLKLFVVDLAELDPVWRIILFIGFGAMLLVLGYFFPTIWRGDEEGDAGPPQEGDG